MTNILHEQVIRPRCASQSAILSGASSTERNTSTVTDQTDIQLNHVIDTVVDFDADVMLRQELIAGTMLSEERFRILKSLGTMDDLHVASAITVANAASELEDLNFPNFDSACSTVLTNSMLNCSAVEEYTATIMQAESGGGIYPRVNGKLCWVEQPIPAISDDCGVIRSKNAHAKKPDLRNRVKRIKRRQLEASALATFTKDTRDYSHAKSRKHYEQCDNLTGGIMRYSAIEYNPGGQAHISSCAIVIDPPKISNFPVLETLRTNASQQVVMRDAGRSAELRHRAICAALEKKSSNFGEVGAKMPQAFTNADYASNSEEKGIRTPAVLIVDQPRRFSQVESQQPYINGGVQHESNFACVENSCGPAGPGNPAQCAAGIRHSRLQQLLETNLLTKEDIKEIERIVREIAADNMLPGSTDVEAEFTTRDCDPLVSGITSYGSANNATGDAYGAEVTYLPLSKLDDNAADAQAGNGNRQFGVPNERDDAADDAGEQEGDIKRVPIVDINAAQDADEIVACANLEYSKEQARPLSGDQQWMNTSGGLTMSMSKKAAMGKLITAERIVSFTANAQVTFSLPLPQRSW